MKCDEARPACLRCISTRRTCDGYSVSLPSTPSSDIHPCDQSRQAFGFFVLYTRHQFAGFFASPFWERMVLQASHHESAIRHALVAIGSLHQDRIQHRKCANRFALEQYSLSIQSLLQPSGSHGCRAVDVSLICAVLFTYFEVCIQVSFDGQPLTSKPRICKATMSKQAAISKAVQSYYERLFTDQAMEDCGMRFLSLKVRRTRMSRLGSLSSSSRDWMTVLQL